MSRAPAKPLTAEQVKQQFQARGETLTDWADRHGYDRNYVYRVLNGQNKALYGRGHEIAVKLGMKPDPATLDRSAACGFHEPNHPHHRLPARCPGRLATPVYANSETGTLA